MFSFENTYFFNGCWPIVHIQNTEKRGWKQRLSKTVSKVEPFVNATFWKRNVLKTQRFENAPFLVWTGENEGFWNRCRGKCHSRTTLIRAPKGQSEVSVLERSLWRRHFQVSTDSLECLANKIDKFHAYKTNTVKKYKSKWNLLKWTVTSIHLFFLAAPLLLSIFFLILLYFSKTLHHE